MNGLGVAVPERWQVEAVPGSLQVRWRWFTLASLSDEGAARFLEVKFEQVMNIVDQAVAGELRR